MSNISPQTYIQMAEVLGEKGVHCLDTPVSGGETGAISAASSIMVGGPKDVFEEVFPIFQVMGKTITYCGDYGTR